MKIINKAMPLPLLASVMFASCSSHVSPPAATEVIEASPALIRALPESIEPTATPPLEVQCSDTTATPSAVPTATLTSSCSDLVRWVGVGNLEETELLVGQRGCDINALRGGRETPLMLAARAGYFDIASYVIQQGADVNYQMQGESVGSLEVGQTALWEAVSAGNTEIVELLLNSGANPNLYPAEGLPLLILAVTSHSSPDIARLLVDAGIETGQTTGSGDTVMTYDNGPSAETFEYLATIGIEPVGLSEEVIESLQWENQIRPGTEASVEDQIEYLVVVAGNTKSARAREDAVLDLERLGPVAMKAIPTLVEIVNKPLNEYDWSGVWAVDALIAIGPSDELTQATPTLLEMLRNDDSQQVRIRLIQLLANSASASNEVIDALVYQLQEGETQADRVQAALGLAVVVQRHINDAEVESEEVTGRVLSALTDAYKQDLDEFVREEALEAIRSILCR